MKPAEIYAKKFTEATLREVFHEVSEKGTAAGKDGVTAHLFEENIDSEIETILRKVRNGTYNFTTYKEKLIPKGADKKPRQVSLPTVRDKIVLKTITLILKDIFPDKQIQLPHNYVRDIKNEIETLDDSQCYLRLDVENFFPSIDHKILLKIIRRTTRKKELINLLESALKTYTGDNSGKDKTNEIGVPQGLSISNILSSIYFHDVDKIYRNEKSVRYFRYVDDILVVGNEDDIKRLSCEIPITIEKLCKIKCHKVGESEKSQISDYYKGIEYLGYNFIGGLVSIRNSSYQKMFSNMMKNITAIKHSNAKERSIWRMNLRISGCKFDKRKVGWIFFFSQTENKSQLLYLDEFVRRKIQPIIGHAEMKKVKRFIKAYHEVRFNADESKYFPDFDNFNATQQKNHLRFIGIHKPHILNGMSDAEVFIAFRKSISKEIADAEKDMMQAFS